MSKARVVSSAESLEVSAHQETAVPGLYAVGDVVASLNQMCVAMGHAAIATSHIHQTLRVEDDPG